MGSGKTTAAGVAEPFFTVITQRPDGQGVRRASVGVLRDTYRNLYATTMKLWLEWVPKEVGEYRGSDDRPAFHKLEFMAPYIDGTPGGGKCVLEVEWRAMGSSMDYEATCRGWALHGAYVDEADLVPFGALSYLGTRVQRGGRKEARVSRGVWATFNKPDVDHPLYRVCEEEPQDPRELAFFDQPPGLLPGGPPFLTNPAAENLARLDDDYYVRSALQSGSDPDFVRRMLRNEWGTTRGGEPVYPEAANRTLFLDFEMEPEGACEIIMGQDGGGTPAAVIMGRDPRAPGRRIVFAEVVLTDPLDPKGERLLHSVGLRRWTEALEAALHPRFSRCRVSMAWADPSAFYGVDRPMGELSTLEAAAQRLRFPLAPAPSNATDTRMDAVRTLIGRVNAVDGKPDLLINPSCRWLRRGFAGDFKWEPLNPLQPHLKRKRQKTPSSHVMEALEYACLGDLGRAGVISGERYELNRGEGVLLSTGERTGRHGGPGHGGPSYATDWSVF
ncbi:MAG: hypothetical protein ACK4E3_10530 [Brevundimonas sp.]|uniref:hypothetical protein n=1 Tax=Brevundimonas sp. TaxID=1871086 RepID=UPI00391D3544